MRGIIALVLIVIVFVLIGWISFTRAPGHTSINLETHEIKKDTQEMINSGSELLNEAGAKLEQSNTPPVDPVQNRPYETPVDRRPEATVPTPTHTTPGQPTVPLQSTVPPQTTGAAR